MYLSSDPISYIQCNIKDSAFPANLDKHQEILSTKYEHFSLSGVFMVILKQVTYSPHQKRFSLYLNRSASRVD